MLTIRSLHVKVECDPAEFEADLGSYAWDENRITLRDGITISMECLQDALDDYESNPEEWHADVVPILQAAFDKGLRRKADEIFFHL